jgi:hypothetical protein
MSFEDMVFAVWIVSSVLTLMIFALDERIKSDNAIKTILFAAIPVVNTAFVFRTFLSWFKND